MMGRLGQRQRHQAQHTRQEDLNEMHFVVNQSNWHISLHLIRALYYRVLKLGLEPS